MTLDHAHLDPAALERLTRLAIAGQQHQDDVDTLLDAVAAGEVDVYQPDQDGYLTVAVGGHRLLRVHRTRVEKGSRT